MSYVCFPNCPGPEPHVILKRAVTFVEITFCRLIAGILAGSYIGSIRPSLTARVLNRAVDLVEITFCRLIAGILAGSYIGSIRPSLTARVLNRAVDFFEITFELLLVKIWHKQVLPSPIVKIKKRDCFYSIYISGMAADSTKSELT